MTHARTPRRHTVARLHALGLAAMLALAGADAIAQGAASGAGGGMAASGATGSGQGSPLVGTDRSFVQKAAVGGMAEVALGKMAVQRASDAQVKQFGERMVTDHSKANDELKQLASARGLQLPAAPDRSHQRDAEKLGKLSGAEFDRAYMQHMVDDHKKDVSDFEKASRAAKDPQVREFAARTLPTLQSHLQLAQTVDDAVRKAGGAAGHARGAASGAGR